VLYDVTQVSWPSDGDGDLERISATVIRRLTTVEDRVWESVKSGGKYCFP